MNETIIRILPFLKQTIRMVTMPVVARKRTWLSICFFLAPSIAIGIDEFKAQEENLPVIEYIVCRDTCIPPDPSDLELPYTVKPQDGIYRVHNDSERIAPLEIKAASSCNYYVKLENINTGYTDLEIFVAAGNTVKVKVPLGVYIIKYASGDIWYGPVHHFGKNTYYTKADDIFRFYDDGFGVNGYTIELTCVVYGNLDSFDIPKEDF